jgi:peroxiredoxin
MKLERIIEQCEPARREVTQRGVLRYELESSLRCPAQLANDRRQEITQALAFRQAAEPLLSEPARNPRPVQALARRIAHHLENQPPTPYRQAVLLVKQQVEAASRGEALPVVHRPAPAGAAAVPNAAAIGEPAPDFVASEITGTGSARPGKWKGKPALLVFYHPGSFTAADLLRFAQDVHKNHGRHASVVGLSVSDDTAVVLKQRTALGLGFPILHGAAMRVSYGVETTPKLVILDGHGIVRGMYLGWGGETAAEVLAELRKWLPGR